MLKHYFQTAVRNIIKSKLFSFINITGFALGICIVILILYFIQYHFSFNNFHEKSDRLYKVSVVNESNGVGSSEYDCSVAAIGPDMLKEFPEVENYARACLRGGESFRYKEVPYFIQLFAYVDTSYFSLLTYKFIEGNKNTCLLSPNQIVLAKSEADRIFGKDSPVGKMIITEDNDALTVTGVFEDLPETSDIRFTAFISMSSLYNKFKPNFWTWQGGNQFITYLLLKENCTGKMVEDKIPAFMWEKVNKYTAAKGLKTTLYLKLFTTMHLSAGLKTKIYLFSLVAALILLLASINFINLNNSKSLKRNTEIGVRKVIGAGRIDVIIQFIFESFVMIMASAILAVLVLIPMFLLTFNDITGMSFTFTEMLNTKLIIATGLTILVTCILSSIYPSFVLSSFHPINVLRKDAGHKPGKMSLRNMLVVLQFAISIAAISVTFLIANQMNYIKNKDLGFDKENQLILQLDNNGLKKHNEVIKNELSKISGVTSVCLSTNVPGMGVSACGYKIKDVEGSIYIPYTGADADFLTTYNIKLLKGRDFMKGEISDENSCIINEALARKLNWADPLGKEILRNDRVLKVVGVIKDFNYSTMYEEIEPFIISNNQDDKFFNMITMKIKSPNTKTVINSVKDIYARVSNNLRPTYFFLNENIEFCYASEMSFKTMFSYFSSIAIFIALMGIAGLTLLTVARKKKEIAVRKVLGASIKQVSVEVSKKFLLWIALSNIIAWPAAYYFIKDWLSNFVYKAPISPLYFLLASILTLSIAAIIIGINTIKAAVANPVDSLGSE